MSRVDFHYIKTGTGELSGPSFVDQTEQAINELGDYFENVEGTANSALSQAQNAQQTANSAQQTANSAVSQAQNAQASADAAQQAADQAQTTADNALEAAQNAGDEAGTKAPIMHASTATTYGVGSSTLYGHVQLSDATNGAENAASGGTAATPYAVAQAMTAAQTAQSSANSAQQVGQSAQETANQAQRAAEAAQNTADSVQTSLDQAVDNITQQITVLTQMQDFVVTDTAIDVESYAGSFSKLYLTSSASASTGLPSGVSFPCFFWTERTAGGDTAMMYVLSDNVLYSQSGVNTTPDGDTDTWTFTGWQKITATPDGVTIANNSTNQLMAQDVAIGGDESDLASARGLLNSVAYADIDFNQLKKQGFYAFSTSTAPNGPGIICKTLVLSVGDNKKTVTQIAFGTYGTKNMIRGCSSSGEWSLWNNIITAANIGDGITVNNGILSVPEYEGATASASATSGLVPPAAAGQEGLYLSGGGEWDDPAAALRQSMIGMIATFASTNLPEGWMACDGSSVLFSDWPEFQTAYNAGRFTGMTLSSSDPSQVGKFVLNGSTGVYLPDLEGLYEQASSAANAGGYLEAGLPNIKGEIGGLLGPKASGVGRVTGCFYSASAVASMDGASLKEIGINNIGINASKNSKVYSDAINTVQPPSVRYVRAMYLGKPSAA